jgi:putative serine protease PepD
MTTDPWNTPSGSDPGAENPQQPPQTQQPMPGVPPAVPNAEWEQRWQQTFAPEQAAPAAPLPQPSAPVAGPPQQPAWQAPAAPPSDPAGAETAYGRYSDEPLPVCDYTGESDEPCEEPAKAKRWSGAAVVTAAIVGSLIGGLLVAAGIVWAFGLMPNGRTIDVSSSGLGTSAAPITISTKQSNVDVAQAVAQKVVPSVVNVKIEQAVVDPFSGTSGYQELGNGSGIIIRPDGYILTNYHVVNGADRILVSVGVQDKVAKVVGVDPTTDLAVIKIDGSGYPAIEVGSSKDLQVGQWVMAVGSPFGLEKTVTSGIVSALQRSEQAQGQTANDITTYTNLIQTDAAINPGNSGGALVDEQGKLVGLNSLIQSPSGGVGAAQSAGIGFAIPSDFAVSIANQLITSGKATHPYLGVSTQTVSESLAAQYGLNVKSGAIVRFVSPGGPADKAGLKSGDIITKIGDSVITGVEDVFAGVRQFKIGDVVPVQLVRGTQTLTLNITLGSDSTAK